MKATTGLGLIIAGLAVAVVFLFHDRAREQNETRELRQAIEHLRERPGEGHDAPTTTALAAIAEHPVGNPAVTAAPATAVGARTESPPQAARFSGSDQLAHLDVVFDSQPPDRAWARDATPRLQQGLVALVKDSRGLDKVECRSSLCRAHFASGDASECRALGEGVVHQKPPYFWEGPTFGTAQPQGDGCQITLVFGRQGAELPLLD